jgi:hypothetical protein
MRQRNLQINKFIKGMQRDGIEDPDFLQSCRHIENYDIDYTRGQLVKRNGYQRYNLTALPAAPQQVYVYHDLSGNENILCISDTKLYLTSAAASNTEVKNASVNPSASLSFTASTKYPFVTLDDGRCVFADDNDVYWGDNTSLGSNECYQLGIDKPTDITIGLQSTVAYGYEDSGIQSNTVTDTVILGQSLYLASAMEIDAVRLYLNRVGMDGKGCSITLHIYADDSGAPDTNTEIDSGSVDVQSWAEANSPEWIRFSFTSNVTLSASTWYWLVLEGDAAYNALYTVTDNVSWRRDTNFGSGKAVYYDGTWNDYSPARDFMFQLGGQLETGESYRYLLTYYNSDYLIESAPIDNNVIVNTVDTGTELDNQTTVSVANLPASVTDAQVTHLRLYRTTATDTNNYYLVATIAEGITTHIDSIADANVGSKLTTTNTQRPLDTDGTAIVPRYLADWRGRLWLVKSNDRTVYYSMRLEDDGALGYTGFSLYDAFHTENFEQLDTLGEPITGIAPLGDMLVAYTENRTIPILGCNSVLNPMDDLAPPERYRENVGCMAPNTLASNGEKHFFVSRRGIEEFDGNSVTSVSHNSARGLFIGSMRSRWENISSMQGLVTADDEYWLIADEEATIILDEELYDDEYYATPSTQVIYLLDLEKDTWRCYNFYSDMNHIHAVHTGNLAGTVLMSASDSNFVMNIVSTVYSDRDPDNTEMNVAGLLETQELRALNTELAYFPRRFIVQRPPCWHHIFVEHYSSSSTDAPFYTFRMRDKEGLAYAPLNISTNARSSVAGTRINSQECMFRVRQFSKNADEIRRIVPQWTEF